MLADLHHSKLDSNWNTVNGLLSGAFRLSKCQCRSSGPSFFDLKHANERVRRHSFTASWPPGAEVLHSNLIQIHTTLMCYTHSSGHLQPLSRRGVLVDWMRLRQEHRVLPSQKDKPLRYTAISFWANFFPKHATLDGSIFSLRFNLSLFWKSSFSGSAANPWLCFVFVLNSY